jgi:DNA invertase Pin-like site-specific DNA recombinase
MLIGYGRTSTADQQAGIQAQERDLSAAGCDKLFIEQVSSIGRRQQLDAALDYVREGDTLIVTKLDRLARSVPDLLAMVAVWKPRAWRSECWRCRALNPSIPGLRSAS